MAVIGSPLALVVPVVSLSMVSSTVWQVCG